MNIYYLSPLLLPLLVSGLNNFISFSPSFAVLSNQRISADAVTIYPQSQFEYVNESFQSLNKGLPRRREGGGTR